MAAPSELPEWADGGGAAVTDPSSGKKALGWLPAERPAAQFMNWWMNNVFQWVSYFNTGISPTINQSALVYQAYVGSEAGCTHATLAAALADSGIVTGSRIFVRDAVSLATVVQVSKNDIEIVFHPTAVYTAGGAASGIQISATGVRVKNGRFVNFATAGVLIDAGSDFSTVENCRFKGCTADITDNNTKGSAYGNINED